MRHASARGSLAGPWHCSFFLTGVLASLLEWEEWADADVLVLIEVTSIVSQVFSHRVDDPIVFSFQEAKGLFVERIDYRGGRQPEVANVEFILVLLAGLKGIEDP